MQKGHCTPHAVDAVGAQYTVGAQYAVDVSAKRSTHTVGYTVGMQYAVGVSAKRSTHTVVLSNMGGGDYYL